VQKKSAREADNEDLKKQSSRGVSHDGRRGAYLSTVAMMTQLPHVGPKPRPNPHPQRLARSSLLSVGSITWSYLRAPNMPSFSHTNDT
jgi:hypothetical protein